ncbi:MAG: RimK family alpha-L-glutamate ligase [Bacteroidales bacterium]
MKVSILRDNNSESSLNWEIACDKKEIRHLSINMLCDSWIDIIFEFQPDFCVIRPPGNNQYHKRVFDEKLFFLEQHTHFKIYPGLSESLIYENKASLSYFLKLNKIQHSSTFVSHSYHEAKEFIVKSTYPLVAKTLIGAAGSGVVILESSIEARKYIDKAFSGGIKRRFGPNRKTGSPYKWISKALKSPRYFFNKLEEYKQRNQDTQKNVVLFQEYIEHDYEWRCVKIGESFFAYKKLKIGNKASGSKEFDYGAPPLELLDFTKDLCDRFNFNFMAVDVFYNEHGVFVNELQTIFGHKNPYICAVDGKPGRFLYKCNKWIFEEGNFNNNESYDLRLETAINLHAKRK